MSHSFTNWDANHFPGYTRGKISFQLEETEENWFDEKEQRIANTERLKGKIRSHNDVHWELKAVQSQLEEEREEHRQLQDKWETSKERLIEVLEASKQFKRDQKYLKQKARYLEQQLNDLKEIGRGKKMEACVSTEKLQDLRREHCATDEQEAEFVKGKLKEAKEMLKEAHKQNREKDHYFDVERKRWEAKQQSDAHHMKRVQFEREQAQLQAHAAQKKLKDKRAQLEKAFAEIEELENELKESDAEIQLLHSRATALQNEKIQIKQNFENERASETKKTSKAVKQYGDKIRALQAANDILCEQIKLKQSEREIWRQQAQAECSIKLHELKAELEAERDINRNLTRDVNETRRADVSPQLQVQERLRVLQSTKLRLEDSLQDLRKKHEKEFTIMSAEAEAISHAIEKISAQNETLKAEKSALEKELRLKHGGDAETRVKIAMSDLEETHKELSKKAEKVKAEREEFVLRQQISEKKLKEREQKDLEKLVYLEEQRDSYKRQISTMDKKLFDYKHQLIGQTQELQRLSEYPELAGEYQKRLSHYENALIAYQDQVVQEKADLGQKIRELAEQKEDLIEKASIEASKVEDVRNGIKKVHQREYAIEEESRTLRLELDSVKRQITHAEEMTTKFQQAINQVEHQLSVQVNALKRQHKEQNQKLTSDAMEAHRKMEDSYQLALADVEMRASRANMEQSRILASSEAELKRWKDFSTQLQSQVGVHRVAIAQASQEVLRLRSQLTATTTDTDDTEKHREELKQAKAILQEEKSKFLELKEAFNKLEAEKKATERELQAHKASRAEADKAELAISEAALKGVLEELRLQEKDTTNQAQQIKEERVQTQKAADHLDNQNNQLTAEKNSLLHRINHVTLSDKSAVLKAQLDEARATQEAHATQSTAKVAAVETEISQIQNELPALSEQLQTEKDSYAQLIAQKSELEKSISRVKEDLEGTRASVTQLQHENGVVRADITKVKLETEKKLTAAVSSVKKEMQKQLLETDQQHIGINKDFEAIKFKLAEKDKELQLVITTKKLENEKASTKVSEIQKEIAKLKQQSMTKDDSTKKLEHELNNLKLLISQKEAGATDLTKVAKDLTDKVAAANAKLTQGKAELSHASKLNLERVAEISAMKETNVGLLLQIEKLQPKTPPASPFQTPFLTPGGLSHSATPSRREARSKETSPTRLTPEKAAQVSAPITPPPAVAPPSKITVAKALPRKTADAVQSSQNITPEELDALSTELATANSALEEEITKSSHLDAKCATLAEKVTLAEKQKSHLKKDLSNANQKLARLTAKASAPEKAEKSEKTEPTKEETPQMLAAKKLQAYIRGKIIRTGFEASKSRQQTLHELLQTESKYVDYLRTIVEYYIKPLSILDWLSTEEIAQVFGNVEELLASNSKFLGLLKNRLKHWTSESTIGDLFVSHEALLHPHQQYVKKFAQAKEVLAVSIKKNEQLKLFLDVARFLPQSENKTLDDLLIMPIQRVPRYKLILTDLLKRTQKSHPDFNLIEKAIVSVSSLATSINETNRFASMVDDWKKEVMYLTGAIPENKERGLLDKLSSAAVAIKSSPGKEIHASVFLTTDYIVIAKTGQSKKRLSLTKSAVSLKIIELIHLGPDTQFGTHKTSSSLPLGISAPQALEVSGTVIDMADKEKLQLWLRLLKSACTPNA